MDKHYPRFRFKLDTDERRLHTDADTHANACSDTHAYPDTHAHTHACGGSVRLGFLTGLYGRRRGDV